MSKQTFTVLVFVLLASPLLAQTPPKEGMATLSGSVTLNGSAVRNAIVSLQMQFQPVPQQPLRTKTDADGRFRFADLAAGQYQINALTPGFYSASDSQYGLPGRTLNVGKGETIENLELQLKRGAVITGQVTDENNEPIAETQVQLQRVGDRVPLRQNMLSFDSQRTDDRGVYRIYGLPPGKYHVSAGVPSQDRSSSSQNTRAFIEQTFHPDTTDQAKAKIIEVEEGQVASDVDIRITKMKNSYEVSGRVVDAQTGQPVSNLSLSFGAIHPVTGRISGWVSGGYRTDANGEYYLLGFRAGRYEAFISGLDDKREYYSDPVTVTVTDKDLSGIEIRALRGAVINGVVVIEGSSDPAILAKRTQMQVGVLSEDSLKAPSLFHSSQRSTPVKPDGSFQLTGVTAGKMRLVSNRVIPGLTLVRVEQNGAPVKDNFIEVRAGEQIKNIRFVFAHSTAAIRGRLVFTGAEAPEKILVTAFAKPSGNNTSDKSATVDARGNFVIEGLPPGEYLVRLSASSYGAITDETVTIVRRIAESSQRVTISNNTQAQITFTIDLPPEGKKK